MNNEKCIMTEHDPWSNTREPILNYVETKTQKKSQHFKNTFFSLLYFII